MQKRFSEYLRLKNVSFRHLAMLTGINTSVISRFCSGGNISSEKLLRLIEACDDLSLEWLFFGSGRMIRSHGDTITYNNGQYAGADVATKGGVLVRGSDKVSVGGGNDKDALISERDRTISQRDALIAEKDALIRDLLDRLSAAGR